MNRKTIILFSLGILLCMCLVGAFSGFLLRGIAPSMKSPETNETVLSPPSITSPTTLSIPENATTSPIPVVNYTTVQQDIEGCPVILTHPPEEFTCPGIYCLVLKPIISQILSIPPKKRWIQFP